MRNKAWLMIHQMEHEGRLRWWHGQPGSYPELRGMGFFNQEELSRAASAAEARRLQATWPWTYFPMPEGPHDYPATPAEAFR